MPRPCRFPRFAATALLASVLVLSLGGAAVAKDGPLAKWPPKDFLVKSLVASVDEALKTFHPETGRFFTVEPWISTDQNVLLPLAVAWGYKHPGNKYYHDAKLLAVIGKGGEALVDDQDANGMWLFRKKDNSTWGMIHMPWTYSRWIRAYVVVKDALPAAVRAKWEKGLKLGFAGIRKEQMGSHLQNIPCHHAMALYIAGKAFGNKDWMDAAADYQHRIVAAQYPEGYWTENFGPVITYNMVYVEALGVYYSRSRDPKVLPALERAVKFHNAAIWSDGTPTSAIDERVIYHNSINVGDVGFTFTPEGRGYMLAQLEKSTQGGQKLVGGDFAAVLLQDMGNGPSVPPAAASGDGATVLGKNEAATVRRGNWEWTVSSYATPPIQNRWIQDRQNMVDVFYKGVGLLMGGGNTKLQPYWSTFTVGDPTTLHHKAGDVDPQFIPKVDLAWTPLKGSLASVQDPTRLDLTYDGNVDCSVTLEPQADGALALTYKAPAGKRVQAHLPLMKTADTVVTAKGQTLALSENEVVLDAANIGDWIQLGRLRVNVPAGASLRWPCRNHDPYTQDGHSPLYNSKLVLVLPFDTVDTQRIVFTIVPEVK